MIKIGNFFIFHKKTNTIPLFHWVIKRGGKRMGLKAKRNLWLLIGVILAVFIRISILFPGVNFVLAFLCFMRAYTLQRQVRNAEVG